MVGWFGGRSCPPTAAVDGRPGTITMMGAIPTTLDASSEETTTSLKRPGVVASGGA
jgi:hypothetical protein